jgi:hypothetical protein
VNVRRRCRIAQYRTSDSDRSLPREGRSKSGRSRSPRSLSRGPRSRRRQRSGVEKPWCLDKLGMTGLGTGGHFVRPSQRTGHLLCGGVLSPCAPAPFVTSVSPDERSASPQVESDVGGSKRGRRRVATSRSTATAPRAMFTDEAHRSLGSAWGTITLPGILPLGCETFDTLGQRVSAARYVRPTRGNIDTRRTDGSRQLTSSWAVLASTHCWLFTPPKQDSSPSSTSWMALSGDALASARFC